METAKRSVVARRWGRDGGEEGAGHGGFFGERKYSVTLQWGTRHYMSVQTHRMYTHSELNVNYIMYQYKLISYNKHITW